MSSTTKLVVVAALCSVVAVCARSPFSAHSRIESSILCDSECAKIAGKLPPVRTTPYTPKDREDFEVHGVGDKPSYAGFFTTAQETNNNMFWWYFPARNGNQAAPLLIWLQGGPGGSSLFGLFSEMGPYEITPDLHLQVRSTTWNNNYAMLFIDNPVGAGFSYTTEDAGYCTNSVKMVASNLYSLITQFYGVFPELLDNDLYITGESYGGHYVPAFGDYIRIQNQNQSNTQIPLRGVAIGDGWVHPVEQVKGYPELMYNMGFLDWQQRVVIQNLTDTIEAYIVSGDYLSAFDVWDKMLNGDVFPYGNLFHNISGSNDYDNMMNTNAPASFGYYPKYVTQDHVRAAIHVGSATFNDGSVCEHHLLSDFMVSLKPQLENLLNNGFKVLIYSGQLDIIIGAPLTERFMQTLNWEHQDDYLSSDKMVWRVNPLDQDVAGYVRVASNLQHVVVRQAGHILPHDQPERALDMITHFVEDIPYQSYPNPLPSTTSTKTTSSHNPSQRAARALTPRA